ncbi:MAG: hypothetical protein IKV03_05090 [Alphaproteobacteria bacterium]|nr:hypothetical protein [Alphaproteobacteria bacterium]
MKYFFIIIVLLGVNPVLAQNTCSLETPLIGGNEECLPCDTDKAPNDEACSQKCPNRTWHKHRGCELRECLEHAPLRIGGGCQPCDFERDVVVDGDWDCAKCPNRHFYEDGYGRGTCTLACPEEKPIKLKKHDDEKYQCFSCDAPEAIELTRQYGDYNCLQCPNREIKQGKCVLKGECPKEYPIRDRDGACRSPNDPLPIYFPYEVDDKKQCALYPQRMMGKYNCILKECPQTHPMRDRNGGCYACDADEIDVSEDICNLCPNRFFYTSGHNNNHCINRCPDDKPLPDHMGKCYSCDYEKSVYTNACHVCSNRTQKQMDCVLNCPADKPLQDKNGVCRSCDDVSSVVSVDSKQECDVCPNRTYIHSSNGVQNGCVVCSADKPLLAETGHCFKCDDVKSFDIIEGHASNNLCTDVREIVNGKSRLKQCPSDKPLRDVNGSCYSCEDKNQIISVNGVEENCQVCSNRTVKYGYCILPQPDKPIISVSLYSLYQYSCDAKGDYGIRVRKIEVTGTEDSCLLCPNRKVSQERRNGTIKSYCVGKE